MSGHRRQADGTVKPTRAEARSANHLNRVMSAVTGEAQAAHAFDWCRSVISRHPRRDHELNELATDLMHRAQTLERSTAA